MQNKKATAYEALGYVARGFVNGVAMLTREYKPGEHCGVLILHDGESIVLQSADVVRILNHEVINMKKYTQKQLEGMTSSELLAIYNEHAEKPLAKFQDKASAVERTFDVLPDTKEKKVGPCAIVWATADSMPGAARKDVLAACVEQGINKATASTQYQKWKVNHENN